MVHANKYDNTQQPKVLESSYDEAQNPNPHQCLVVEHRQDLTWSVFISCKSYCLHRPHWTQTPHMEIIYIVDDVSVTPTTEL